MNSLPLTGAGRARPRFCAEFRQFPPFIKERACFSWVAGLRAQSGDVRAYFCARVLIVAQQARLLPAPTVVWPGIGEPGSFRSCLTTGVPAVLFFAVEFWSQPVDGLLTGTAASLQEHRGALPR